MLNCGVRRNNNGKYHHLSQSTLLQIPRCADAATRGRIRTGDYRISQNAAESGSNKGAPCPETLIAALAAEPALLERPIVVTAKGAAICRPPEKLRQLL